jgi:hypothetical protein
MKFLLLSAVAASLFFAAAAVTYTTYTDAACGTPRSTSDSAPNPVVANLNECTKYMTSPSTVYVKPASCGAKAAGATYSDDKCANKLQDLDSETDKCLPGTGGTSSKVTCAPASSISIAIFTVLAAMLALF